MVTEGPTGVDGILKVTALGGTWSQATFPAPPPIWSSAPEKHPSPESWPLQCSSQPNVADVQCCLGREEAQELSTYCSEKNVLQRQGGHWVVLVESGHPKRTHPPVPCTEVVQLHWSLKTVELILAVLPLCWLMFPLLPVPSPARSLLQVWEQKWPSRPGKSPPPHPFKGLSYCSYFTDEENFTDVG